MRTAVSNRSLSSVLRPISFAESGIGPPRVARSRTQPRATSVPVPLARRGDRKYGSSLYLISALGCILVLDVRGKAVMFKDHHASMPRRSPSGAYLWRQQPVSYTHLRAHETVLDLVCRLL